MDYERHFLDHLELIEQLIRATGRRRHLAAHELEDFDGFVKLKLIEDDYAVLRKFQQRSSFWTYLATVIERLSLDFCVELWGRWRPSTMAERLGPDAVLLERLVTRDGHSVDEAIEMVRTNYRVTQSEAALRAMWAQLPPRTRPLHVGESAAAGVPAAETAEARVADASDRADVERVQLALERALNRCTSHERLLLALRYEQELGIADIAAVVNSSPATLHRRLAAAHKTLHAELAKEGIARDDVAQLVGRHGDALAPLLRMAAERLSGPVRLFKRDG